MCYKIEVQNKNAEKLNKKLEELNAPQFLRDYLNELESKNGALNYLVAIKDFLQWLIENNIINKKLISEKEDSDFPDLHPHILRHTFATRCIEKGVNYKTLQTIMGHSDFSITLNVYSHTTNETLFNEMKKIEN